jgi:hypothetical protein
MSKVFFPTLQKLQQEGYSPQVLEVMQQNLLVQVIDQCKAQRIDPAALKRDDLVHVGESILETTLKGTGPAAIRFSNIQDMYQAARTSIHTVEHAAVQAEVRNARAAVEVMGQYVREERAVRHAMEPQKMAAFDRKMKERYFETVRKAEAVAVMLDAIARTPGNEKVSELAKSLRASYMPRPDDRSNMLAAEVAEMLADSRKPVAKAGAAAPKPGGRF